MKLPKVEYIIILVCLFAFVFFTTKKCSATKDQFAKPDGTSYSGDTLGTDVMANPAVENDPAATRSLQEDLRTPSSPTAPTTTPDAEVPLATPSNRPARTPSNRPAIEEPVEPQAQTRAEGTTLYTISDGVNVRAEPSLTGKSLGKLPLYSEVSFTGKVSDNTTELSIGKEKVRQPWVQIKTKRGTVGWIFGAYVSYYKKKNSATW